MCVLNIPAAMFVNISYHPSRKREDGRTGWKKGSNSIKLAFTRVCVSGSSKPVGNHLMGSKTVFLVSFA